MTNPYGVLGLARSASLNEIKRAFRRLAKNAYHDLDDNNPISVKRFNEVTEAYAILSDPEQKASYDLRDKMGVSRPNETETSTELNRSAYFKAKAIRMLISQLYIQTAPLKAEAIKAALKGFFWLIAGGAVTLFSYNNADETGGRYIVFYGAIIFGGIQCIRAFIYYFRVQKALTDAENELWETM